MSHATSEACYEQQLACNFDFQTFHCTTTTTPHTSLLDEDSLRPSEDRGGQAQAFKGWISQREIYLAGWAEDHSPI